MKKTSPLTRLFLMTLSSIGLLAVSVSCVAEDQQVSRIMVTGQGSVSIAPDMAVLTLSVNREAETAREALDANSLAMKDVLDAMKDEGIEDKDLQTTGFSIQPRYVYPGSSASGERKPPKIVGYTVRNTLNVRVRDITAVGRILDASVTLGVNEGGDIMLTNADPSEAIKRARIEAVGDALEKAETLAKAAGVDTGHILEISEQSFSPRPVPMARAEMSMVRSADAVPVASGENTYKVNVNISMAIEQ